MRSHLCLANNEALWLACAPECCLANYKIYMCFSLFLFHCCYLYHLYTVFFKFLILSRHFSTLALFLAPLKCVQTLPCSWLHCPTASEWYSHLLPHLTIISPASIHRCLSLSSKRNSRICTTSIFRNVCQSLYE